MVMEPRPGNWDCKRGGAGGVPIETEHGWLIIYHAYNHDRIYLYDGSASGEKWHETAATVIDTAS